MKTLFVDIDGILCEHTGKDFGKVISGEINPKILPGVSEAFSNWSAKGYNIILTTGRRESSREHTVRWLQENGLQYDTLIMGLKNYPRVLINDAKSNGKIAAEAYVIPRNEGLAGLDI